MKIIIAALIILVAAFAIGCSKDSGEIPGTPVPPNPSNCNQVNAKFTADISPIIQNKCATASGCHGTGSFNGPGELKSFNQIKNASNSIKTAVNNGSMPLNNTLTSLELQQINCWVNSGSPNN